MRFLKNITTRQLFFLMALLCCSSVAFAFYAEYYQGMEPCPLCIAERVVIGTIGLLALIYALHNPTGWMRKIYSLILISCALFGIKIAAHHLWLMGLPPELQPLSCGLPLSVLFQKVPLHSFLHTVLQGDAECGKVTWLIFGLKPPFALIILCSIIILLSLTTLCRKLKIR